jgi:hypothetical protein
MTSVLRIFNKGKSEKIDYIDSILNDERPSNEETNKQFELLLVRIHMIFQGLSEVIHNNYHYTYIKA